MWRSDSLELIDLDTMSDAQSRSPHTQKGCRVGVVQGFILTFSALTLVVVVGLVVYLSLRTNVTQCLCQYPGVLPPIEDQQWQQCLKMAPAKNICCGTCSSLSTVKPVVLGKSSPSDVRLPLRVKPTRYELTLKPDIYTGNTETFTFSGNVSIHVTCVHPTDVITLHSNKIHIGDSIGLVDSNSGNSVPAVIGWKEDKSRQFLKVYLSGELARGHQYILNINFHGPLERHLSGIYWSSYKSGHATKYLVVTQMEPTDARKTFPCFDEPAVKARFSVTLLRKTHMRSLSNMNIIRSEARTDGWVADVYNTSVKMSTYLVAFVICDFDYNEEVTNTGIQFRVWSRPEALNQTKYALEKGVKTIEFFETYFQIPFPLPKQDMIAVPDFAAGAMENWGLIIYREVALLYDEASSSAANKERVAEVVVHELSHQWFGNLVSPFWWDDLWLNEGFASYMEYIGMDHIEPSWAMQEQFIQRDMQNAFKADALTSSHPIYVPVNNPDEINEIFDSISYNKGSSIIRMMNYFLGDAVFKIGLSKYLKHYSYSNANHTNLWNDLGKEAADNGLDVNVADVMSTWILQMGYPVVTIHRSGIQAVVTQEHFLSDRTKSPSDKYHSPYSYKWDIPLNYVEDTSPQSVWDNPSIYWFKRNESVFTINNLDAKSKWIIGNVGRFGFYRVNYDNNTWNSLIEQLNTDHTKIPVKDRAQMIDDAITLSRSGYIDALTGMRTTQFLKNEDHYVPWKTAQKSLKYYDKMLRYTEHYGNYKRHILGLSSAVFSRMDQDYNQPTERQLNKLKRALFTYITCEYGHKPCRDQMSKLFGQWMNRTDKQNRIKPDLRSVVYCNGIRNGGLEEWDFLYGQYKSSTSPSETNRILYALSCSEEPWILNRLLKYSLDADEIRRQDGVSVIVSVSNNPIGKQLAWNFVQLHWPNIMEHWGHGIFSLANLVKGVTSSFNTELELEQLLDLKARNPDLGVAERAYQQAVEITQDNIRWLRSNLDQMGQWLQTTTAPDYLHI